ncbi:MAG: hypothetical protein ACE5GN_07640, partial [Waddliaceae bacterium]
PVLRDYMKLELGTENPQDITVEMMYDYALKKGAQSLENVAEGKSISEEELEAQMDKAIENLGAIAYLAKPLLKHRSFAGLIIGGIGHFLLKVTLNPIIGLISRVVKGISDRKEKDYTKTIWYRLTEGRKKAHEKRDAREKIYKPIREIVQSDRLWQRIYNRIATTQNPKIKTEQTPS